MENQQSAAGITAELTFFVQFEPLTPSNLWPPEHNKHLDPNSRFFKAQGVLGLDAFVWVSCPAVPEVSVEGTDSLKELCPSVWGDLFGSSDAVLCPLIQGCTNLGRHATVATASFTLASNMCGSSVWNLLHVTLLAPRILRWLQNFWKIYAPLL